TTFDQAVADAQAYQKAIADAQANNTTPDVKPPQIIATVVPPGSVTELSPDSASGGNPLTFDQAATTYDKNGIVVDLLSPIQADGKQYIGLSLFGAPLQPGQQIVFSLTDPNLTADPPQFLPVDSNVHITQNASVDTDTGNGSVTVTVTNTSGSST